MLVPFINLTRDHEIVKDEIMSAITSVVDGGVFVLGENVNRFESNFSKFVDARYCITCANGLDALVLSLKSIGVGDGDEVIVPSNTFIATWLAVSAVGAIPVAVDPELSYFNIDPQLVEERITSKTKAIIAVHLYGQQADMPELSKIAKKHGLYLLEDAAQAHGSLLNERPPGALSSASAWSFYPGKNLGAMGDGGCITTNDESLALKSSVLRNYGSSLKYVHDVLGYNSRLDEIQAAILDVKLKKLEQFTENRSAIAGFYLNNIANEHIDLPRIRPNSKHAWHLFVIRTKYRTQLQDHMTKVGVHTLIHYPIPPSMQVAYSDHKNDLGSDLSKILANEILSIPIFGTMNLDEAGYVVENLNNFMADKNAKIT